MKIVQASLKAAQAETSRQQGLAKTAATQKEDTDRANVQLNIENAQLESNIASLDIELSAAQRARLDAVSALESVHPYMYFGEVFQGMIHGGAKVRAFPA